MNIVTVCGSVGRASANRAALDVAVRWLEASDIVADDAYDFAGVPVFRPEEVDQPPEPVPRLRKLFESADVVLLAAPEYAGGVAGSTKNALDWMVGSGSLHHKVVAVMSVGTTGGEHAIEQLVRTLSWQGALVVSVLGVAAPKTKTDDAGRFTDKATIEAIDRWVADAMAARRGSRDALLGRVAKVVVPYGIDPARFGDLG